MVDKDIGYSVCRHCGEVIVFMARDKVIPKYCPEHPEELLNDLQSGSYVSGQDLFNNLYDLVD